MHFGKFTYTHTHTYSETVAKNKITNIFFTAEISICSFRFHFSPNQEIPWPFFSLSISQNFLLLLFICCVWLFLTPRTAARQAYQSFTISWSLLKLMSIELEMLPNHLILCHHFLLLLSIFPSIRVFSNELALPIKWPKYWSFSISPSYEYSGLISFRID